jgi:hypothetical protein
MMKRLALLPAIALALGACSRDMTDTIRPTLPSAPQFATNFANAPTGAHYAKGSSEPVCTVNGLTISCTGTVIQGVGNTNADLALSVTYTATVRCRNNGDKIVDVKTKVVDDAAADVALAPKNGNLQVPSIDISAAEAPTEADFLAAATCPNPNWSKLLLEGTPTISSFSYSVTFVGFTASVITLP